MALVVVCIHCESAIGLLPWLFLFPTRTLHALYRNRSYSPFVLRIMQRLLQQSYGLFVVRRWLLIDRWYIHALLECANETWVVDAYFATRGRRSSRPDSTAPFPECSLSTSTKFVRLCLLWAPLVITCVPSGRWQQMKSECCEWMDRNQYMGQLYLSVVEQRSQFLLYQQYCQRREILETVDVPHKRVSELRLPSHSSLWQNQECRDSRQDFQDVIVSEWVCSV